MQCIRESYSVERKPHHVSWAIPTVLLKVIQYGISLSIKDSLECSYDNRKSAVVQGPNANDRLKFRHTLFAVQMDRTVGIPLQKRAHQTPSLALRLSVGPVVQSGCAVLNRCVWSMNIKPWQPLIT